MSTKHRRYGTSKRSQRRQRSKSRSWLEVGLRALMEVRADTADRLAKLDAKIKRQEARILESSE